MTERYTIHCNQQGSCDGLTVDRFTNSVFHSNSYIVYDEYDAIVVDIGDYVPLKTFLDLHSLSVKALLVTHTHYDHIYGIREFMRDFPGVPVYTSTFGKEAFWLPNRNFSRYHDDVIAIHSDSIRAIGDGDKLTPFTGCSVSAMATPGHDESCLSYVIGDGLFTGDSYIPGTKVIASFPKSDKAMAHFWYRHLEQMACKHTIYPGHGEILH